MITNDQLKEVKIFQYPLALQKLAMFVMEAYNVHIISPNLLGIKKKCTRKANGSVRIK
jgi:hypothetical protein